jgi:hypothetical protein
MTGSSAIKRGSTELTTGKLETPMNKNEQYEILGTLQADAQMLVNYTMAFMVKPAFRELTSTRREELTDATYCVTASLGRHLLVVLDADGLRLRRHLEEFFPRLEHLARLNKELGLQYMAGAFEQLRAGLIQCGLTYLEPTAQGLAMHDAPRLAGSRDARFA